MFAWPGVLPLWCEQCGFEILFNGFDCVPECARRLGGFSMGERVKILKQFFGVDGRVGILCSL